MNAADVLTAVLLPSGAAFSALGGLGLLRFPDVLTRLHAATKPQTIGLLLVLIGASVQMDSASDATPLLLVVVFQLLTASTVTKTVGAAAYRAGVVSRDALVVNEAEGVRDQQEPADSGR